MLSDSVTGTTMDCPVWRNNCSLAELQYTCFKIFIAISDSSSFFFGQKEEDLVTKNRRYKGERAAVKVNTTTNIRTTNKKTVSLLLTVEPYTNSINSVIHYCSDWCCFKFVQSKERKERKNFSYTPWERIECLGVNLIKLKSS